MVVCMCLLLLSLGMLGGCSSSMPEIDNKIKTKDIIVSHTSDNIFKDDFDPQNELYEQVFPWVLDSTYYKNPSLLIEQLSTVYGLKNPSKTVIINFELQQLHGLLDSVLFINCATNLPIDSTCLHPTFHTQYLFSSKGKLIYKNQAAIAQFIPNVIDSLPIYMSIQHDCSGYGHHHFYSYQEGKLIDIFNVFMNEHPTTYDANPENGGMIRKKYFDVVIQDSNQDGFNDIVLKGKWLVLENKYGKRTHPSRPFKAEKVVYHFLYKPTKEYFLLEPSLTTK